MKKQKNVTKTNSEKFLVIGAIILLVLSAVFGLLGARGFKLINKNGNVISIENIGKKRLAYEVKKNKEGIYIEINFTSEASFIAELERQYKIDENVIKFIVIRKED